MNKPMHKKTLSLEITTIRSISSHQLPDARGGQKRDTRYECGDSKNYCGTDLCSRICF